MNLKISILIILVLPYSASRSQEVTCDDIVTKFKNAWVCRPGKLVGRGSTSVSFLVKKNGENKMAVAKAAFAAAGDSEVEKRIKLEVSILQKVKDQNVIELIDSVETDGKFYQILEYALKGSLKELVANEAHRFNDPRFVLQMFRGIVKGVAAVHAQGFVHCDLKMANIVVMQDYTPKIIDFDLAVRNRKWESYRGTALTMDPRILVKEEFYYTYESDIYSLGVILFNMANGGAYPFTAQSHAGLHRAIRSDPYTLKTGTERTIALLISKCLQYNGESRANLADLLQLIDEFLNSDKNVYIKELQLDTWQVLKLKDTVVDRFESVNLALPNSKAEEKVERPINKEGSVVVPHFIDNKGKLKIDWGKFFTTDQYPVTQNFRNKFGPRLDSRKPMVEAFRSII